MEVKVNNIINSNNDINYDDLLYYYLIIYDNI